MLKEQPDVMLFNQLCEQTRIFAEVHSSALHYILNTSELHHIARVVPEECLCRHYNIQTKMLLFQEGFGLQLASLCPFAKVASESAKLILKQRGVH